MKKNKGITLIALVITIIVMLILVAVTITVAVNGGLFEYAKKAGVDTNTRIAEEQDYSNLGENLSTDDLIEKYTTYGTTYKAYKVGDIVTISGENFYVIEDSDETKSTVKLLAAKCVDTRQKAPADPGLEYVPTPNPNYNKQSDSANTVAFDNTQPYSNVYADSTIKGLVDSYVASLGVLVKEGRLMTIGEIISLGGNNGSALGCPAFIYAEGFWLGSPDNNYEDQRAHAVDKDRGGLGGYGVTGNQRHGLRPVIVISKSNIPAQ